MNTILFMIEVYASVCMMETDWTCGFYLLVLSLAYPIKLSPPIFLLYWFLIDDCHHQYVIAMTLINLLWIVNLSWNYICLACNATLTFIFNECNDGITGFYLIKKIEI